MLSHGPMFNLVSAKVYSPAIIETYLSYDKDISISNWLFYVLLLNSAIFIGSYTSNIKFYSFIIYRHFLSLTFFSLPTLFGPLHNWYHLLWSLLIFVWFISSISHGVENYFPGLWGMGIPDAIFFIPLIVQKQLKAISCKSSQMILQFLSLLLLYCKNFIYYCYTKMNLSFSLLCLL